MIKIIKSTYGLLKNGAVEAMTKQSAPFSLSEKRESELVSLGVAKFANSSDRHADNAKANNCIGSNGADGHEDI